MAWFRQYSGTFLKIDKFEIIFNRTSRLRSVIWAVIRDFCWDTNQLLRRRQQQLKGSQTVVSQASLAGSVTDSISHSIYFLFSVTIRSKNQTHFGKNIRWKLRATALFFLDSATTPTTTTAQTTTTSGSWEAKSNQIASNHYNDVPFRSYFSVSSCYRCSKITVIVQ